MMSKCEVYCKGLLIQHNSGQLPRRQFSSLGTTTHKDNYQIGPLGELSLGAVGTGIIDLGGNCPKAYLSPVVVSMVAVLQLAGAVILDVCVGGGGGGGSCN